MEFKTKKFADLSFGNYLSYDHKFSFNHIIDQRVKEINQYFKNENECKKYIISNELYIYTYEEEYYDKFIFMVKQIYGFYDINLNIVFKNSEEDLLNYLKDKINNSEMPKFDYIIQNPPYNGSMHLDFFKLGLKSLKEDGKMIIIEPSQWLTNLRHTNKLSEKIKEKISNHVKSVTIENLNEEFNIANFTPLTITKIDLENIFKNIDFKCCGEEKIITNLNDANLIGNYKIIKSILDKCTKLDIIKNHSTNKKLDNKSIFYIKCRKTHKSLACVDVRRIGRNCRLHGWRESKYQPFGRPFLRETRSL